METKEIKEVSGNGKGTLDEVMAQLLKDAENTIEDIGEEVRRELADDIAIIKDQFEKRKYKIMEKAKKNASDKTVKITDKIRETLINRIEQASTNKISEVLSQADHELEDLFKLSHTPTTKDNKEVSDDNTPDGEADVSQAEGKNVVETEHGDKIAKSDNIEEIDVSFKNNEDGTKPTADFNEWLAQ